MTSHTDAMRAALEPFAKVAEDRALDGQVADDSVTIGLMNGYITQTVIYGKLTVADFRRARAALSAPPASAGGGEGVDLEGIEKRVQRDGNTCLIMGSDLYAIFSSALADRITLLSEVRRLRAKAGEGGE